MQARRDGLKVEFGALEVWLHGIAGPYDELHLSDRSVRMVNRESLQELYRRGITELQVIPAQQIEYEETAEKVAALERS